jgi:monooxygenase
LGAIAALRYGLPDSQQLWCGLTAEMRQMSLVPNDMPSAAASLDRRGQVQHFDVLIVGAGLSGIAAGYYLQARSPRETFAILEARQAIGGTWDLFRYPGVRSDSDLYTFGFSFRPWREDKAIAGGGAILRYLKDTASEYGIDRKIRFGQKVKRAAWNSSESRWTLEVERVGEAATVHYSCNFLYICTGYYDYDLGYMPGWPGMDRFTGTLVHPQDWPETLDYRGRPIIVIGSGSTAVTLIPALAEEAAHVTMVQRSPSYVVSLPASDTVANWLRRVLPDRLAHGLSRWKNVLVSMFLFTLARRRPAYTRRRIMQATKAELGPDYDAERHFTPSYNPWDQRVCLVPDGDLFKAIRSGRVSIVTDTIESFTETGLQLASGKRLDADIIVTATGLRVKLMGGIDITIDGKPADPSRAFLYKGMMLSDVPNLAYSIGYTNASWTLKCELIARYVCRILNHMRASHKATVVPRVRGAIDAEPAIHFTSGYIQRALSMLPKQGSKKPWRLYQNYALDLLALKFGRVDDDTLEFGGSRSEERVA